MSDLVKIYQSANPTQFMLARGLLEDAEIEVLAKNFEERNLFGYGSMGAGYNILVGQFELHVLDSNVEQAREVLLEAGFDSVPEPEDSEAPKKSPPVIRGGWLMAGIFILLTALGIGGPIVGAVALLIGLLCYVVMLLLGGQARRRLHQLGYEWVTLDDAASIRMRLGANFQRLPTAAELETIPGFRQTASSLVEHFHRFRKHHPTPAGQPEA